MIYIKKKYEDKNTKENNKGKSKKESLLISKVDGFLSKDFNRKFPILSIIGAAVGIILIILGIILMLTVSERVVDSVASGETETISISIIFLGILILGISLLKIFTKNIFNDSTLLDRNELDNKKPIEKNTQIKKNSELDK